MAEQRPPISHSTEQSYKDIHILRACSDLLRLDIPPTPRSIGLLQCKSVKQRNLSFVKPNSWSSLNALTTWRVPLRLASPSSGLVWHKGGGGVERGLPPRGQKTPKISMSSFGTQGLRWTNPSEPPKSPPPWGLENHLCQTRPSDSLSPLVVVLTS